MFFVEKLKQVTFESSHCAENKKVFLVFERGKQLILKVHKLGPYKPNNATFLKMTDWLLQKNTTVTLEIEGTVTVFGLHYAHQQHCYFIKPS